jgi:hypothetical protein
MYICITLFDALTVWNNTNSSAVYWYIYIYICIYICTYMFHLEFMYIYIYIYIFIYTYIYTYIYVVYKCRHMYIHKHTHMFMNIYILTHTYFRGNKNVFETQLMFFSNFPWRDDLPCAGTFLLRPTNYMEKVIRLVL